jgi:hypothetical protein
MPVIIDIGRKIQVQIMIVSFMPLFSNLTASSAGSKIGNYFLSLKLPGFGNRVWSQLLKKLW